MTDRILVTGASGFIGAALVRRLRGAGFLVRGTVRDPAKMSSGGPSESNELVWAVLHDRSDEKAVIQALRGVQSVIHLAARVHIMADHAADPLREFRQVNRDWTERLARAAASQGVRRFVYLSSVKVNGEHSVAPFTEQDLPKPEDPYGISKWEAEQALARVSVETGLETVVLRSPLVYGPGVGGNFLQLMKIVQTKLPLPFAGVTNLRSLVYRGNLVDALMRCVRDATASGRTYFISDGEDLSTPELIRRLSCAMGIKARLWPFPVSVLRWLAQVAGKGAAIGRLAGSLQVDSSKIRRDLGWHPPFSLDQGLAETAAWFCGRCDEAGASF